MTKISFNRPVKYNGVSQLANTPFDCKEEDVKELVEAGGTVIKPAEDVIPTKAQQAQAAQDEAQNAAILAGVKAEAEALGVTVEEADTAETLKVKIDAAKADKVAKEAEAALATKKSEADALGIKIADDDTIETLQAKIDEEKNREDADTSPYKGLDKAGLIAELVEKGIDQKDLTNNEKREAALLAFDAAQAAQEDAGKLEALKAEAATLGVTVEEADTIETLTAKIAEKQAGN